MITNKLERSSLNAVRHGVTRQVVVLPQPDMEACSSFTSAIVESFEPKTAHEIQLAQCYATFQWRINRVAAVEDSMFTLGIMEDVAENLNLENPEVHNAVSNAKTFRHDTKAFDRLGIYNQRLISGAAKVLKQLEQLQTARRRREEQEMADAARLYQFHCMQKTTFDPGQNGFELTIQQIQAHIRRTILHNHAQIAAGVDFNPVKFAEKVHNAAA